MKARNTMTGLSLVELMVALALGLFIVGVGIALVLSQMREQHRRMTEVRLRQEIRNVLAFAEHDLRRAGSWGEPGQGVWTGSNAPIANPYPTVSPEAGSSASSLAYQYSRDTTENHVVDAPERFGLRLNASTGVIEARIGDAWQALTDPQIARFTQLTATVRGVDRSLVDRCTQPCPVGAGTACPPIQRIRTLDLELAAQATPLPALRQRQQRVVHLPHDVHVGSCPTG